MIVFLVVSACIQYTCAESEESMRRSDNEIQMVYKNLFAGYNPKLRPNYLGPPVNVSVDATILSFTNLDPINMMYTVDMYFRQRWSDHRLRHNMSEKLTLIVGTKHPANIIWTPDTVFINSVKSRLHSVTVNNHKLDIYPDGSVFWGTRVTVSPSCHLQLEAYPMDYQVCDFKIVSYAFNADHVAYWWHTNPGVLIPKENTMAQFTLINTKTSRLERKPISSKMYTLLKAEFKFKRLMGFAVLQIYVPSTAIVCVSWVSLWIRRSATPARVALCITTLLTIATIWSSVNSQLPRVNYVKAIDIYLMTSFCCVILTLIEYTIVLNFSYISEKMRKRKKKAATTEEEGLVKKKPSFVSLHNSMQRQVEWGKPLTFEEREKKKLTEKEEAKEMAKKIEEENEKVATKIESFARIILPLMYLTFNIFYWAKYLGGDSIFKH